MLVIGTCVSNGFRYTGRDARSPSITDPFDLGLADRGLRVEADGIASSVVAMRYKAELTAGSLKVQESRVVADLLLRGVDDSGWREAMFRENVLQTRSPQTAKRLRTLLRHRLETMDADLWRMIRDGSVTVVTHACLAAAIKHSPLLGDFLDLVVRDSTSSFGSR